MCGSRAGEPVPQVGGPWSLEPGKREAPACAALRRLSWRGRRPPGAFLGQLSEPLCVIGGTRGGLEPRAAEVPQVRRECAGTWPAAWRLRGREVKGQWVMDRVDCGRRGHVCCVHRMREPTVCVRGRGGRAGPERRASGRAREVRLCSCVCTKAVFPLPGPLGFGPVCVRGRCTPRALGPRAPRGRSQPRPHAAVGRPSTSASVG